MNNDNSANNQNNIDVYTDDPSQGQERNRVTDDTQTSGRETTDRIQSYQQSGSDRDRTLQQTANQNAPISSGQQSSTSSDASGVGGFSQPESGFGQQAQGGNVQPQSGYNESGYNRPGTYSQGQGSVNPRMDGMRDTQGSGYDQQQGDPKLAQQPSNANQSGTQPAVNTPGVTVDTPGRETGNAWGNDEQMGSSTDTADRRNPAQ